MRIDLKIRISYYLNSMLSCQSGNNNNNNKEERGNNILGHSFWTKKLEYAKLEMLDHTFSKER